MLRCQIKQLKAEKNETKDDHSPICAHKMGVSGAAEKQSPWRQTAVGLLVSPPHSEPQTVGLSSSYTPFHIVPTEEPPGCRSVTAGSSVLHVKLPPTGLTHLWCVCERVFVLKPTL